MCDASRLTAVGHRSASSAKSFSCLKMLHILAAQSDAHTCRRPQPLAAMASRPAIGGASDAQGTAIEDVRVDHRGTDIRVAEQFLNRSNVVSRLEQMRRKGMTKRVATDPFCDSGSAHRGRDRALHDGFVQMIPGRWSESRVSAIRDAGNTNCQLHSVPALGLTSGWRLPTRGTFTTRLRPRGLRRCRRMPPWRSAGTRSSDCCGC